MSLLSNAPTQKLVHYALCSLILSLYFCLFQEVNTDDETWFLQVVHRVVSGEILYRDIFFGTTPLSVYIASFFAKLFGSELIILRAVLALYFSLSITVAYALLQELGIKGSLFFALGCFVFSSHRAAFGFSGYNALATLLYLVCFLFTLRWFKRKNRVDLILGTLFAALCFSAKHNVGLIAFGSVVICLLVSEKKSLVFATLLFLGTIALLLLPIWLQGGGGGWIEYALLNKRRYLALENASYFNVIPKWTGFAFLVWIAPFLIFFLPLLKREKMGLPLWIFLYGSLFALFPRPDDEQKMLCVFLFLIAILYVGSSIHFVKRWQLPLKMVLSLSLTFFVATPLIRWKNNSISRSHVRHFRKLIIETPLHQHWYNQRKEFRKKFAKRSYFFLSTHAGLYYLLFDLKNPTPFDYPIHSALGLDGEKRICETIDRGVIQAVISDHPHWSNWERMRQDRRPFALEGYIETKLEVEPVIDQGCLKRVFQVFSTPNS